MESAWHSVGVLLIVTAIACWIVGLIVAFSPVSVTFAGCGDVVNPNASRGDAIDAIACSEQLTEARMEVVGLFGAAGVGAPLGAFLVTRRRCPRCGGLSAQGPPICRHCGQTIDDGDEAA